MKPTHVPEAERYEPPPAAKIFCGLIYVADLDLGEVLRELEQMWGPVEFISRRFPFDYTRYYAREMGSPLSRRFAAFREEVEQKALPAMKWQAKRVEGDYLASTGGRRVNIDPGLLLPERLLLATTKPCAHRPYLDRGIYADLTLVYHRKSYQPLEWTYPDYAAPHTVSMMNNLRERYALKKRASRKGCIE